jgi:hypothetical protein
MMDESDPYAGYIFLTPPPTVGHWKWHKDDNSHFCMTALPNKFHRFMIRLILGIYIEEVSSPDVDKSKKSLICK